MSEKTYDGLAVLSNISGLPRDEVDEIWKAVQENQKRLSGCLRHRFDMSGLEGVALLRADIPCLECGGTMRSGDIRTYIKGYIAAGGDPEEVWPGWSGT
jgi:hypothetical protein